MSRSKIHGPMKRFSSLVILFLAIGSVGCAYPPGGAEHSRGGADLITSAELDELGAASTALDLIQRLRPNWLRTRGAVSFSQNSPIMVYVDRVRLGGPRTLTQIPASTVESIQFLDAMAATRQFGTDHANGAILVTTRN